MIAQITSLVATVATVVMVLQARPAVRFTNLTAAWVWAVIAAASWSIASAASFFLTPVDSILGQLWYLAAVLTLCPWISVLGARHPTVRVWNWFVIAPLIAVLLWPVALSWAPVGSQLVLSTPQLVGFGLVLVMGMGNYVGTRFTILACLTLLSELILIASLDPRSSSDQSTWFRAMAATILVCGVMMATRFTVSTGDGGGWNGLWRDFRDAFGIVWANRIAARVNAEAVKGNWTVRLHSDRFVSATPGTPVSLTRDAGQIDHTMRWLLRRFVDEEWINARVWTYAAPGLKEGGSLAGNDSIEASSTLS